MITQAIRSAIVSGQLKPGERLREEMIAKEHGVSRIPVREALRHLEAEDFVTLTQFRGATVSVPSPKQGLELLVVRRGLEALAARLAAERRAAGYEHSLLSTVDLGVGANRTHDAQALRVHSLRFHELIRLASGNAQLKAMLDKLLERISWVFAIDLEERAAGTAGDHAAIAHAIVNGSPLQAGYLMDEHVVRDASLCRAKSPIGS